MKKTLLFLLIISPLMIFSQVYNIANINNQTISTCSGTFYDSGGPTGNFQPSESYTVTFCPSTPGGFMKLNFTSWHVGAGDNLEIFDGPNTSANSFGVFNNTMSPVGMGVGASILNPSGCITFQWSSATDSAGWEAALSCGLPCQSIQAALFSSVPAFHLDSGIYYIDICPSDTIKIRANAIFPNNNQFYHQDTATSKYFWNFGNGKLDTGQSVVILYDSIRGYNIRLKIIDTLGCLNTNSPEIRVRISTKPDFKGTVQTPQIICLGQTALLKGKVNPKRWRANASLSAGSTTFLPDGSGVSYTSSVMFTEFAPGQTLQNPNHFLGICAEMEHSYLGDLNLTLKCPNNSSVTLKQYPGGGGTFLGEPIDDQTNLNPGIGYTYCWRPNGTTTMVAAAGTYNHTFTDAAGTLYTNASFLPPSTAYPTLATAGAPYPTVTYLPVTPFNSLVGCPLNGLWTITVTDNLLIDNGFIFKWSIDLSPTILPVNWEYTPSFANGKSWKPDPDIISTVGDNVTVLPTDTGFHYYTFRAIDNFGCSYDTTISVYVLSAPKVNLGNDTLICGGNMIVLAPGNNPGATYLWSTQETTPTIQAVGGGVYSVTVTYQHPTLTCKKIDTINLEVIPMPWVHIGKDTCTVTPYFLDAGNPGATYLWSTGDTTQTVTVNTVGTVTVTVNYVKGSPCWAKDDAVIKVIPDPIVDLGPDLEVCRNQKKLLSAAQANTVLYDYLWEPIAPNQGSFVVYKMPLGLHTVKVSVTGCSTVTDEVIVDVIACDVVIPNIITPNGDSKNDVLDITNIEHFPGSILLIYDRWGKKVFESKSYNNNWDGENLADGVYYFVLILNDADITEDGEKTEYNGTITLLRQ